MAGQILAKSADTNYAFAWVNAPDASNKNFVVGPTPTVSGRLALFDGTNGALLKQSTLVAEDLATKAFASAVSQKDFTNTLAAALDAMVLAFPEHYSHYRGKYANKSALDTAAMTPEFGDYAFAEVGAQNRIFFWDQANSGSWVDVGSLAVPMTAQAIASLVFAESTSFNVADSNIFTDAYKVKVDAHEALLNAFSTSSGAKITPIRVVNSTATVLPEDRTVVFNISSDAECQLPGVSGVIGNVFAIKCISSTGNSVTVKRAGSETIDGINDDLFLPAYESVTIQASAVGWVILS
jgi:hypothetical protein